MIDNGDEQPEEESEDAPLSELLASRYGPLARKRGESAFRGGLVGLRGQSPGALRATVYGGDVFDVELCLDRQRLGESRCSCLSFSRVGPCQHLWAVVLYAESVGLTLGSVGSASSPTWAPLWKRRLEAIQPHIEQDPRDPWTGEARREERLVFVLELPDGDERDLVLRLYTQRRRRSHDWGARRPYDPSDQTRVLSADEKSLVSGLRAARRRTAHVRAASTPATYDLDADAAAMLLPPLARRGRLFWKGVDQPLREDREDPFELELQLIRDEEREECALGAAFVRGDERVSIDAPLCVVRGLLVFDDALVPWEDHGLFAWARSVRSEGVLRAALREEYELVDYLVNLPGAPRLLLPEGLEQVAVAPTPELVLEGAKGSASEARLAGRLLFDYSGARVAASDPHGWLRGPEGAVVPRDRKAEKMAREQLLTAGAHRGPGADAEVYVDVIVLPEVVRALTHEGWRVLGEGKLYRVPGNAAMTISSGLDWFELTATVEFEGETATSLALMEAARSRRATVALGSDNVGLMPEEWLERWGWLTSLGTATDEGLRFAKDQAWLLDGLLDGMGELSADDGYERAREGLKNFAGVKPLEATEGFNGTLRTYQSEGIGWMEFLRETGLSGCLADDMGLGKTVQVLAFLEHCRKEGVLDQPSLIVAPRSLTFNWIQEAARFTPALKVIDFSGPERHEIDPEEFGAAHLIVTTYGILRRDIESLAAKTFEYVVLDESQAIKNHASQSAKAARRLQTKRRLALSGTPVENHLGELWSLFEFLSPGMLGRSTAFQACFGGRSGDAEARKLLARALRPFLLRRTKEQVLSDLPEKTEQVLYCDLPEGQRTDYETLRSNYRESLMSRGPGQAGGAMHVLEALLRLRQIACHPGLIDKSRVDESCAKLARLLPLLHEVVESGHKALVFSQFTSLLDIVELSLNKENITFERLDGRTRNRAERVNRFQEDPDCPVFLISLKAGGLGLNLTAADYVFLLDPWWNPAVERQAIDRTHRMGQTRPVFAYRLIARDTVEERVLELQERKRSLVDAVIPSDNAFLRDLSRDEVMALFS